MQKTTIHQPAPCHESWEAMAPTAAGRHCAACQTQVVDFTRMTDGEVVAFLGQYHPVRRCGQFREDQVGRPLVAEAQPVTGWRRWASAAVLLLGSVMGLKARAQGERLGYNARAMAPAATTPTAAAIPDSMFLVQGVVRNRWGVRKQGALVIVKGVQDTTNTKGYFQLLLPKSRLENSNYIVVRYWRSHLGRNYLAARILFDSTRTKPFHITLKKVINRNPGFF